MRRYAGRLPTLRVRPRSMRIDAAGLVSAALACGASACTDETGFEQTVITPTSISVDPDYFVGDVRCSPAPGGLKSYVATLIDVTDPEAELELASSPPTPCTEAVQFRFVVVGHAYAAEIQGYEQDASELVPSALDCAPAPSSGSRHMCAKLGGQLQAIEPRWTASCGRDDPSDPEAPPVEKAIAEEQRVVPLRACKPLQDAGEPAPPAVIVDPMRTLGSLECASGENATAGIVGFDVEPLDPALPPLLNLGCGELARFETGLVPDKLYEFRVRAHDVDPNAPPEGARCFAVAEADAARTATCDPLTDRGAVRVAPAELGLDCPLGTTYVVELIAIGDLEPTAVLGPIACEHAVTFPDLLPGAYQVSIDAATPAVCGVDVEPGPPTSPVCGGVP